MEQDAYAETLRSLVSIAAHQHTINLDTRTAITDIRSAVLDIRNAINELREFNREQRDINRRLERLIQNYLEQRGTNGSSAEV